jgi:hypothetical protein
MPSDYHNTKLADVTVKYHCITERCLIRNYGLDQLGMIGQLCSDGLIQFILFTQNKWINSFRYFWRHLIWFR